MKLVSASPVPGGLSCKTT